MPVNNLNSLLLYRESNSEMLNINQNNVKFNEARIKSIMFIVS